MSRYQISIGYKESARLTALQDSAAPDYAKATSAVKFAKNNIPRYMRDDAHYNEILLDGVKRICSASFPRQKDVKNLALQIAEKRIQREEYAKPVPSVRAQLYKKWKIKLDRIAAAHPRDGYSMGSVYTVEIQGLKDAVGRFNNCESYSGRAKKYTPAHGHNLLILTPLQFRRIQIIAGLITEILPDRIKGNRIKELHKVRYLVGKGKKQYAYTEWQDGYLILDHHFPADSDAQAIIYAKTYLASRKVQANAGKLQTALKDGKQQHSSFRSKLSKIFVQAQDSLQAGNCMAGTISFARRFGIDLQSVGAVRADYLLQIADKHQEFKSFVTKAIVAAYERYNSNRNANWQVADEFKSFAERYQIN